MANQPLTKSDVGVEDNCKAQEDSCQDCRESPASSPSLWPTIQPSKSPETYMRPGLRSASLKTCCATSVADNPFRSSFESSSSAPTNTSPHSTSKINTPTSSHTSLLPSSASSSQNEHHDPQASPIDLNKGQLNIESPIEDVLGPFAHMLGHSTREAIRAETNAYRQEDGTICPLVMANLFLNQGLLKPREWPELVEGEKAIERLREESLDSRRARWHQDKWNSEAQEKEEKRLHNKIRYGLVRSEADLREIQKHRKRLRRT